MVETVLSGIRIVLVEPAGPLNVGAIARVMKNMGLQRLVLVNPQCDPLGTEARQMAVHAADILKAAQYADSVPEALHGCRRAAATAGRDTTLSVPLENPTEVLSWLLQGGGKDEGDGEDEGNTRSREGRVEAALIFGREDRGLTNEELNYAQRLIRIPSTTTYASLNLAQAAAICCYELHLLAIATQQAQNSKFKIQNSHPNPYTDAINRVSTQHPTPNSQHPTPPLASLENLEGYYQQLEALLLKIGYLYPHTASSRMEKFRRLFNRAYPSEGEVAMLRGILSQVEWALKHSATDSNAG
jgi:tRNA/rRNA methyltransferase